MRRLYGKSPIPMMEVMCKNVEEVRNVAMKKVDGRFVDFVGRRCDRWKLNDKCFCLICFIITF
jgi:hypothetical protein